jgi:hypothetical protein
VLRHLTCCARAAPRISFVQFDDVLHCFALQTLDVEGLERCNLRSGLPQTDTATSAPAAAAAAAPGCEQPPLLPPLTNATCAASASSPPTPCRSVGTHPLQSSNLPVALLQLPRHAYCDTRVFMCPCRCAASFANMLCATAAAASGLAVGSPWRCVSGVQGPRAAAAAAPDRGSDCSIRLPESLRHTMLLPRLNPRLKCSSSGVQFACGQVLNATRLSRCRERN